jgi:DNA-binding transcriptional ArsR family regulator
MLEITFTVDDLARTRLAMSPLWEVVASVRVLKNPRPPAIHRHWHGLVRSRLRSPGSGVRLLFDLWETPPGVRSVSAARSVVEVHLTAMRDAGLVAAHRVGRVVLYSRTATAEALIAQGNFSKD